MTKEEINFVKALQDKIDNYNNQINNIIRFFNYTNRVEDICIKITGY